MDLQEDGLCWTHDERKTDRLIPLVKRHRDAKERAQDAFWEIYQRLVAYRQSPSKTEKQEIESQFDELCQNKTGYPDLNDALRLLHAKGPEFLAVLEYPPLPLHNNLSENDIREYARLRKISGGTRSDRGRRCRDTFTCLKKTCGKLGFRFQSYLRDRIGGCGEIPQPSERMRSTATTAPIG